MTKPRRSQISSPYASRRMVQKETVQYEFFDPSARIVILAENLNRWTPAVRPLPGSYQYKFVVNGERWEEDPPNLHRVMEEHGTYNSIRTVGANPKVLIQLYGISASHAGITRKLFSSH